MTRIELAPPGGVYGESQSVVTLKQLLKNGDTEGPVIETINAMLNRQPLTDEQLPYAHVLGFESQTGTEGRGRI